MELSESLSSQDWTIKYGVFGQEHAQGGTVVFVHGTPWSSVVFKPLAEALIATSKYRVVLYDLAGYGQSQKFTGKSVREDALFAGDTSVATQAVILTELLRHLNITGNTGDKSKLPAIIAHDIAGTIALRSHLIHECEFRSLLLLDTNTVLPWGDGFYKLARSEPEVFLKLPPSIFEAVVRAVTRSASHKPKEFDPRWEDILAEPWIDADPSIAEQKQRSFIRQIAQANDKDVAQMLDKNLYSEVRCPVKIMWGEQDQWIPKDKMESLATHLKERLAEFVVVPAAGHLVMIDQPERVAVEVFDWLSKQS